MIQDPHQPSTPPDEATIEQFLREVDRRVGGRVGVAPLPHEVATALRVGDGDLYNVLWYLRQRGLTRAAGFPRVHLTADGRRGVEAHRASTGPGKQETPVAV